MKKYRLNIDGIEVEGVPGQTILEVARENDIHIPTLCYDERTKIYGSCGLCMVEVEGNPKLCKACATEIGENMVVFTNTDRVLESRKTNLELLISNHVGDCKAPCSRACPAHTDCQGYVGMIANGQFQMATEIIKDKIPLPSAIGRVCPHPCEDQCRRGLIEEPISICMLKRFAGDLDLEGEPYIPEMDPETGKSVAIIGGGPLGLSAAYFLRQRGHSVTIFDSMPKMGGMLRYGIPEYRLPKEVLDNEVATIEAMGVQMVNCTKIGEDLDFDTIRADHDAVLLAIGAWKSTGVGCVGEDAEGVIGGIDFLRKVVRNEYIDFGEKVAIVGGGNTAMDACRTAVRLGAKEVYNIYRRTKDEMPADRIEIEEGEEEGVIFKNLTNPIEIIKDENGHVKAMKLQIMELGEPDASGRRKPVAVEGKTETIDVDTVILAIGQQVDGDDFPTDKTKKGGIMYDKETFMTNLPGVFAGGDCGNDKISIAIEAIADARKVAEVMDGYLNGQAVSYKPPFFVTRDDITEKNFEDRERQLREKAEQLSAKERKDNFTEVVYDGFPMEQAMAEASRCLQCGCHDYYECKLVDYANQYGVEEDRFAGEKPAFEFNDPHPFIARDPNKCILCGLCVRVCDEVMGIGALGLVNRGFDTVVKPSLEQPLTETQCDSCGQCVSVCPVGAIQEKQTTFMEVPVDSAIYQTTCANCAVGCTLDLEAYGDLLIKANGAKDGFVNRGLTCAKGKWGFDASVLDGRLTEVLIKSENGFREADYHEALVLTAKKMESIKVRNGEGSIAVAISDRLTNEEAYTIKKMAQVMGAKVFSFNNKASGLESVTGISASPNTIDELLSTELIIPVGFMKNRGAVIWNKMKQASENGAKVMVVETEQTQTPFGFADEILRCDNSLSILKEMAKALIDKGFVGKGEGFKEFKESLDKVAVGEEAARLADAYVAAKKAMFVYEQNVLSVEAAALITEIAALAGHLGAPRDGILVVKPKNNSQGIADLGIRKGAEELEGVKGLMIFGEDPTWADLSGLEFLMVSDVYMTDTGERADVVLPATGFAGTEGTFTNTERRLLPVLKAIDEAESCNILANWEVAVEIANIFEEDFGFEDEFQIMEEMDDVLPLYKYAQLGEVLGGVLKPVEIKFHPVVDGPLVDELPCTDYLMNMNSMRIPKPAAC